MTGVTIASPGGSVILFTPRAGRCWGGGSSINAGAAKLAQPSDFARWPRHGIEGWPFKDVLPTHIALENTPSGDDRWDGRSGPFPIRQMTVDEITPALRAFVEASIAAGFHGIDDFNGPAQNGVDINPLNVIDGVLQNTGLVYLTDKMRDRRNLTIRGGAQVDRIEFDGKRASRVRLVGGEVLGAGEIILSAGVYNRPAILMRSGIGSARHLREHNIEFVADLPVGRRLRDYPFYYNSYAVKPEAGEMHPAHGATIWTKSTEPV
jgi:choline dehydrogenase